MTALRVLILGSTRSGIYITSIVMSSCLPAKSSHYGTTPWCRPLVCECPVEFADDLRASKGDGLGILLKLLNYQLSGDHYGATDEVQAISGDGEVPGRKTRGPPAFRLAICRAGKQYYVTHTATPFSGAHAQNRATIAFSGGQMYVIDRYQIGKRQFRLMEEPCRVQVEQGLHWRQSASS